MESLKIIEPKLLSGFRDFLPDLEIERKRIIATLEKVMSSFGFVPIDTPILEYTEILLGKAGGETEKQMYRFMDNGERDIAMRFDLTVPFARFMAQHRNELYLPFKRFHFAKVFRGERAQKGRYREFMQCDFDMVGVDTIESDIEILVLMFESFKTLGIDKIRFSVSHRGLFNSFLESRSISEHSIEILRIVDKLHKIGRDETLKLLQELIEKNKAESILEFIGAQGSRNEKLDIIEKLIGSQNQHSERIKAIFNCLDELGLGEQFDFDPSITRGLDYYTGIVYETFLTDLPSLGSVCSGGRYNDLASLYTKEKMPGVGSSIGLDRLMAGLEELGLLNLSPLSAQVMIANFDTSLVAHYNKIAMELRAKGISCETYPQSKKLPQQFAHAEKKNIPYVIIIGDNEKVENTLNLRHTESRNQVEKISIAKAIEIIKEGRTI